MCARVHHVVSVGCFAWRDRAALSTAWHCLVTGARVHCVECLCAVPSGVNLRSCAGAGETCAQSTSQPGRNLLGARNQLDLSRPGWETFFVQIAVSAPS
eukprot:1998232-Alexandrium_andersonii.AAC.1